MRDESGHRRLFMVAITTDHRTMTDAPRDILNKIDLRRLYPDRYGNPVMVPCPVHKDRHKPNLGVYPRNVYCFHPSCGFHEGAFAYIRRVKKLMSMRDVLEEALKLCVEPADVQPSGSGSVPDQPLPLDENVTSEYVSRLQKEPGGYQWLREKYGLTEAMCDEAGIGYTGRHPFAFTLPIYNLRGELLNIRFRVDPRKEENPPVKYWGIRGRNQACFYLPPPLPGAGETIADALYEIYEKEWVVLTEGEFDALALTQIGIPAISATNGAQALTGNYAYLVDELVGTKVVVCYDQDNVGEEYGLTVCLSLKDKGVRCRMMAWDPRLGKDASELVAKGYGKGDFREFLHQSS